MRTITSANSANPAIPASCWRSIQSALRCCTRQTSATKPHAQARVVFGHFVLDLLSRTPSHEDRLFRPSELEVALATIFAAAPMHVFSRKPHRADATSGIRCRQAWNRRSCMPTAPPPGDRTVPCRGSFKRYADEVMCSCQRTNKCGVSLEPSIETTLQSVTQYRPRTTP